MSFNWTLYTGHCIFPILGYPRFDSTGIAGASVKCRGAFAEMTLMAARAIDGRGGNKGDKMGCDMQHV